MGTARKRRDRQLLLFDPGNRPSNWTAGSRRPRRGTFADALARADDTPAPADAEGLHGPLQRLAKLCAVLQGDAGAGSFALGSGRAAEVVGAPRGDWQVGAEALRELQQLGLVELVRLGSRGQGCSRWRWLGTAPSRHPGLRLWAGPELGSQF
jgi:hypothetical protein